MKKYIAFFAAAATLVLSSCGKKAEQPKEDVEEDEPTYVSQFNLSLTDSLCMSQDPYPEDFAKMVEQISFAMDDAEHVGDIDQWVKDNIVAARNTQYMVRMVRGDLEMGEFSQFPADRKDKAVETIARFDSIQGLSTIYDIYLGFDGPMSSEDYVKFATKIGVPVDSAVINRLDSIQAFAFDDDIIY